MAATIIRRRLNIVLVGLMLLGAGLVTTYATAATVNKPKPVTSPRDLRHEQVGKWNCSGWTTAPFGTQRPFYGVLRNEWTLDNQWLVIRFEEKQPVTDLPLREEQYWGYSEASDLHTRLLMANDGSYAVLTSNGWENGVLSWQGSYVLDGVSFDVTETTIRLAEDRYRWFGSITQNGTTLVSYEFLCTRNRSLP